MGRESPAIILYDINGNPIGSVLEDSSYKLQSQVTGAAPSGAAAIGNPVLIAGLNGVNAQSLKTNDDGYLFVEFLYMPLPGDAATETTLSSRLSEATFTSRINTLGQKSMASSTPVVLASNQSAIPVTVVDALAATQNKIAYDIGETVIYIGTAELASSTASAVWLIKRITLVDGEPTFTEWSDSSAIWDDRNSELYT